MIPSLNKTKTITIAYTPNSEHQMQFHSSKKRERLLMAGMGAGKTLAGSAELIGLAILNKNLASLVVSPSYIIAERTVLPTLKLLLTDSGIKFDVRIRPMQMFLPEFNHTIYFGSADNPESLKGANVCALWCDELATFSEEAYIQAIARVREPRAKELRIFHTTTPEGRNWVWERFIKNEKDNCDVVFGSTKNNKALPKEYIKDLESSYSEELRQMYLEGRVVELSDGTVIPEWHDSMIADIDKDYQDYIHLHKYVAMDIGGRDKTAILFGTYHYEESILYIEDEYIVPGSDTVTPVIAHYIIEKERELWDTPPYLRVSDNNNILFLSDLSSVHGLYFSPTKKEDKIGAINKVRLWVGDGRVVVSPKCSELIACLQTARWNSKKNEFERSRLYGHYDALDALIYMIRNVNEIQNPIPQFRGISRHTHYIDGDLPRDLSAVALNFGSKFRRMRL